MQFIKAVGWAAHFLNWNIENWSHKKGRSIQRASDKNEREYRSI